MVRRLFFVYNRPIERRVDEQGIDRHFMSGIGGNPSGDYDLDEKYMTADEISDNKTSFGLSILGSFDKLSDYIAELNAEGDWVRNHEVMKEVTITSVEDFVKRFRLPINEVENKPSSTRWMNV